MLRKYSAETLQILVFDSPIVSIKPTDDKKISESVNTFISIILYDQNGTEIPIDLVICPHLQQGIMNLMLKYLQRMLC